MQAHFRSSLLNRVKRLTLGRLPNGSVTCGSPFPAVRIISSQCAYFNSESKPSNVAQWDKDAKDELKRPQPLDLSVEGIAIQSECKVPGAAGISIAEKAITFDLPSTIDLQKKCAKQQLDSMVEQLRESDETFFSKVPIIQEISSRLDDGRVPPVFHALGMPHEWLGGKKLCLSLTPVEPGEVKQESRLDLEFHARNKEEIVGDDLKAVKRIEQEGSVAWVFNKIATDWAVNLVNTDAQMRGSNVESTPVGDLSSLVVDDSEKMLLTRPQSRGVVATIFNNISAAKARTTTAITGLPGIGKSWTLLYVLQQALLYEGVFIIFITHDSNSYLFHRRSGKMYAWSIEQAAVGGFLGSEETLAILDSSKITINFPLGKRRLIFASSNHELIEQKMNVYHVMQHYVGPWTEDELQAAFDDFQKDEGSTLSDILERFNRVGGLPRYLMRKARFKRRLTQIVREERERTEESSGSCNSPCVMDRMK